MREDAPPSWLDEAPPPEDADAYGAIAPASGRRARTRASGQRALAGPSGHGGAQTVPLDAQTDAFKRPAEDTSQIARIGHIMGVDRFDAELEAWLLDRQWAVRLNLLTGGLEIHRPHDTMPMSDERLSEIRFTVSYASNGKEPDKSKIADAIALIGERRAYHPILDYLDGLTWDGVERLDLWLIDYLGADDTPLNRAFGRKMLCAAVRRVKSPGCKFDSMLVLEGAQDLGKSATVAALGHDHDWFTDQLEIGADPKVTIEKTAGAWLVEFPELDGMSRRDTNRVKSFITTTHDRARLAYGRYAVTRPRQFVLFGTTNETKYLSDTTGNRRFWIVKVKKADPAGLAAVRDQLWAEASIAELAEKLWLDDPALKTAAAAIARDASDFGPWMELLEDRIPDGPLKIEVADIWRLVGIDGADSVNKLTKSHQVNMKSVMAGLGFEKKVLRSGGRNVRAYIRGEPEKALWWQPGARPAADNSLW